jgi:hypothetical protein
MRKIKKKEPEKDKLVLINKIIIAVIFAVYVFIGICIHINRPGYYENYINLDMDFNDIKNKFMLTLKKATLDEKVDDEEVAVYEENYNDNDEQYIIEQELLADKRLDKYTVKGHDGASKFFLTGKWDVGKIDININSMYGGKINIKYENDKYKFTIDDNVVEVFYKRTKIIGKITINKDTNFYIKNYNHDINIYDEYNNRVASGTYFKTLKSENTSNRINFHKLLFEKKHFNYRQIFLIVFIIYLQIFKIDNGNY